MNIKFTISYDGSRYQGWQRLKDSDKTIQGKIEAVLEKLSGQFIEIDGSGRTDAGVHALGQVANFHIEEDLLIKGLESADVSCFEGLEEKEKADTCRRLRCYMNHYLPEDIRILKVETVSDRFHSRLHATEKWYRYRIAIGDVHDVFSRKYVYHISEKPDLEKMKLAAEYLNGTHDFLPFSALKKVKKSTVRTITEIIITQSEKEIYIDYKGDGFLYHMVRIMTGTLLEVGLGIREKDDINKIFEMGLREHAGYLVPSKGLCLMEVFYKKES